MKALISPNENNRICEIAENDFPIAPPLFWVDCPDDATTEWVYENGTVNAPVVQPETPEQTVARLESALDRHLDSVANSYRYESIRTMVSYENDPNPQFHNEGQAAKRWRSAVYAYGIQVITDVQNGQREIPTEQELIAELPIITDFIQQPTKIG